MNVLKTTTAVLVIAGLGTLPASAGGLFGKGGLIRGSVGNFIHDKVQAPIVTPVIQGAVVAGGAAVGAVAGAKVGAPVTGAAVGAGVGQGINDVAAGKH